MFLRRPSCSSATSAVAMTLFLLLSNANSVVLSSKQAVSSQQQGRSAILPPSPTSSNSNQQICPTGCECDTPGVVSCISARLMRLPFRLPTGTKFFYAEHNRFLTAILSHRNFTNYVSHNGRPSLVGMSLHNCSLTLIGFRTFTMLKTLQELDLSNNRITVIEDNTFNGLNLNMLDLSYNVGIQFSKQAFSGSTIRRLALRAVGLKTFDLTTFSFVFSSLMSLSVADNRLLTLDYRLFACAPNLSTIYLARNPWWCGGDCSTLQLINHVNRYSAELVLDEAPTCQPGYDEQQDLNKAECTAKIAFANSNNTKLPQCPVTVTAQPSQSHLGRSLQQDGSSNKQLQEEDLTSPDGGFVTWGDGVLANYTRPVTLAPGLGAAKGDGNVVVSPMPGGCYRLSTVVAASTMASVATLVIVLSLCLCARACYIRCQNRQQPSVQTTAHAIYQQKNGNGNGFSNGNGLKNGGVTPNGNGTTAEYKPLSLSRNGSSSGHCNALIPSQGQPLLMHNPNESGENGGHLNNGNSRHGRLVVA